jgi:cytochrome c-type biogenesis protein CcmE
MNKRARMRLIGVTVIILGIAAAVFFGSGAGTGSYAKTVDEAVNDATLVGQRVRVSGTVVAGSWDKKTNPMRFRIRGEGKTSGPELSVIYTGAAPNTFGNDTVAIVTGTLEKGGTIAADDMITKCPSKYSTGTGAIPVADLVKTTATGQPVKVVGYLTSASSSRRRRPAGRSSAWSSRARCRRGPRTASSSSSVASTSPPASSSPRMWRAWPAASNLSGGGRARCAALVRWDR